MNLPATRGYLLVYGFFERRKLLLKTLRATENNPPGFAELVDRHGDSVYKLCRSLTWSKEDADDLFQETFLRSFEQMPKIAAADSPQGFLCQTAIFAWKSQKRKYARRNRIAPSVPMDETAADDRRTEDRLLDQEETRAVRELVDGLPERLRIPVVLHYALDMRLPEIAEALRIPPGTVKSRLFKARNLIKKGLETQDEYK
jgi:RNA polymerase sigma-70 factor (ECF subfamily)